MIQVLQDCTKWALSIKTYFDNLLSLITTETLYNRTRFHRLSPSQIETYFTPTLRFFTEILTFVPIGCVSGWYNGHYPDWAAASQAYLNAWIPDAPYVPLWLWKLASILNVLIENQLYLSFQSQRPAECGCHSYWSCCSSFFSSPLQPREWSVSALHHFESHLTLIFLQIPKMHGQRERRSPKRNKDPRIVTAHARPTCAIAVATFPCLSFQLKDPAVHHCNTLKTTIWLSPCHLEIVFWQTQQSTAVNRNQCAWACPEAFLNSAVAFMAYHDRMISSKPAWDWSSVRLTT